MIKYNNKSQIEKFGNCALCGKMRNLTFEHIPPKSCGNNRPVYSYTLIDLCDGVKLFKDDGKPLGKIISQKGFGFFSLCKKCNNDAGSLYINSYRDFYQQCLIYFNNIQTHNSNFLFKNIYPLRIIKAVLMFFVSINKNLTLGRKFKSFLLNKNNRKLPEGFRIFCFFTTDFYSFSFLNKAEIISGDNVNLSYYSQFSYPPLGFILTYNSEPSIEYKGMIEITDFSKYDYDDIINKILYLPVINKSNSMNFP